MEIFPNRSYEAVKRLAKKIKLPVWETAEGIIAIANANMEKAIRVISIERGYDPRNFSLISFGGAGGMHAVEIASQLKLSQVIVPKNAGVLSAQGFLLSDSIKDYSQSILKHAKDIEDQELDRRFAQLVHKGLAEMREEGFSEEEIFSFCSLDLRYSGQSYEITIPFGEKRSWLNAFHTAHRQLYSYHHPDRSIEIVNIRVKSVGQGQKMSLTKRRRTSQNIEKALIDRQNLHFHGEDYTASVYTRSLLNPGAKIDGPALILDYESTTLLPPEYSLEMDGFSNLVICRGDRQ